MVVKKCNACELAMNREGERRPGIHCKDCRKEHCNNCAGLTVEQCEMMRSIEKGFWSCKECESKNADLKAVLDSMKTIKTELGTIKEGQAEVVEAVVKRLDRIEDVQEKQEKHLSAHEVAIKKNTKKVEEGDRRVTRLEEQVEKISQNMSGEAVMMRQTNAVVKEILEIEKCGKNLIFGNVPEPSSDNADDETAKDENQLSEIFKELGLDEIKPTKVLRVGKKAHYPRKVKVIFRTQEDRDKVLDRGESVKLAKGIFITNDRTYNQRQEARLYREEKEREEAGAGAETEVGTSAATTTAAAAAAAQPRGRPRGRPPGGRTGSAKGSVKGKGIRQPYKPLQKSLQKKRPSSRSEERESSRRRTEGNSALQDQDLREPRVAPKEASRTPEHNPQGEKRNIPDRPSTPLPRPVSVSLTPAGTSGGSF